MKSLYFSIISILILILLSAHISFAEEEKIQVNIGDTRVTIKVTTVKGEMYKSGIIFVNLHDKENPAAEAAKKFIEIHGGKVVEVVSVPPNERYINFEFKSKKYTIDPNRIFTEEGRKQQVDGKDAWKELEKFSNKLIQICNMDNEKKPFIIAVHNTELSSPYSIKKAELVKYKNPAVPYDKITSLNKSNFAECRTINDDKNIKDSFLVTDEAYFNILSKDSNVYLQDNDRIKKGFVFEINDNTLSDLTDNISDKGMEQIIFQGKKKCIYSEKEFKEMLDTLRKSGLISKKEDEIIFKASNKDDGSLSVFCAKKDIPYINIEAGYINNDKEKEEAAKEKQLKMIEKIIQLRSIIRKFHMFTTLHV